MKIVLATTNQGKKKEIADIFAQKKIILDDLNSYPQLDEIIEDGSTYLANALIKAKAVCAHTGQIALADDSGLEVAYLNNAPNIYSARYADDMPADFHSKASRDERNIAKLLQSLHNVPTEQRQARYRCFMVIYFPDGHYLSSEGSLSGYILPSPQGTNGFGYDPVFYLPSHKKSVAELSFNEKNQLSHRYQAAINILKQI